VADLKGTEPARCSHPSPWATGCMTPSLTALPVAPTPWGTGARSPIFTNGWARCARGEPWVEEQHTRNWYVLTITKALTKTTNWAFRAKKWRGTTKNNFQALRVGSAPLTHLRCGSVPPLSIFANSFRRHIGTPDTRQQYCRVGHGSDPSMDWIGLDCMVGWLWWPLY